MSDFKFSCPVCGQHLSADTSYIGRLITCPSCNQAITVPAAQSPPPPPPPPPQLRTTARTSAPPPVSSGPATTAAPKTCGLALASLICSCAGLFISLLGTIPGIVCGHLAMKQINRTRGLEGRGFARAGLIAGYVLTVLWLVPVGIVLFVAVASGFKAASQVQQGKRTTTTTTVARQRSDAIEEYGDSTRLDTKSDGAGWTYNLAGVAIPDAAVAGRIHGVAFKPDVIKLTDFGLKFELSLNHPDFGKRELEISFDELRSENGSAALLSKQTIVLRSDDAKFIQSESGTGFSKPSVRIQWFDDPKRKFMTGIPTNYVMRLEFGELKGNALPGKIYLCLPDPMKTFIRGKFVARVENAFELADSGLATRTKGASAAPAEVVPDDPAWMLDLAEVTIPDVSVTGRVHGLVFKVQQVTMEFGELKFRQGAGIFPDREIGVRVFEHDATKLSGRTIQWPASDGRETRQMMPMVSVEWKRPGESHPNHAFANEVALRLEFGELKGNRLPGRIYVCVLDHEQGKSYVRGKFTATVAQPPGLPARVPIPANPPIAPRRR